MGIVGPGVLFLDYIVRKQTSRDPYISHITKAIYESLFLLYSLRYIFEMDIFNEEIKQIIEKDIFRDGKTEESQSYGITTERFKMLLDTQVGQTISRFIQGTFG